MAYNKDISVKYTNTDFNNLRSQLIDLTKNYFPDSYNDFSVTSPGMMFMEMAAYVGDILSFYQDSQLQETFLQYAKDPGNLYSIAYMMGYRPKVSTSANAKITVTQRVQASGSDYLPDFKQAVAVAPNVTLESGNQKFRIEKGIDFRYSSSLDPTDISIFAIAGDYPSEYLLTKTVDAYAGEIVTTTVEVGALTKYFSFDINDSNIVKVESIVDSSNNSWTEVPFLGQSIKFNTSSLASSQGGTGYPNKAKTIYSNPSANTRRFVTRFKSSGILQVQFGSGDPSEISENLVPSPNLVSDPSVASTIKTAYDPNNFLYTNSYGLAPTNTTLTVKYIKGGGVESNVPANTLTTATNVTTTATDTSFAGTLSFTNLEAATGGKDGDTVEELRENSLKAFPEQNRLVTKEDYEFRALTMDPEYGTISKAFVSTREALTGANDKTNDPLQICLYVLSYDNNKKITKATNTIKTSLSKYLQPYMLLTDSLDVKDAFVINLGIKYEIITRPNYNSRETLLQCTEELKSHFEIDKWKINQPINISTVYTLLDRVTGVQTVQNIEFVTKVGGNYSEFDYDVKGAIKSNILYPSMDPMIFEIKYPDNDIEGRITTL